ncbi:hypothetical protein SAMN02745121_08415 [Nannocystis exedens]|uniref:Uncharacterized protein n=1 Tax=Nannocystis exedens TaxID=54 RepID=A0A1I2I572_9BACT|nr:hypothetical protein NAEX_08027 [Nannocystis exedens]SFF36773.1 hypothetical protein SAMN02745121_08415 [Nannocystis exedens]
MGTKHERGATKHAGYGRWMEVGERHELPIARLVLCGDRDPDEAAAEFTASIGTTACDG